ncbi:hypothetical protein EDD15DRAFT_2324446 [Pisolithus albus]|nr:hypothetical protein EDD15DRAFT_2324446 [Pisolithus albus]
MPQLLALSLLQTSTNSSTTGRELSLISNLCDLPKEYSQDSFRPSNQPAVSFLSDHFCVICAYRHVVSFVIPTPRIICTIVCPHLIAHFLV